MFVSPVSPAEIAFVITTPITVGPQSGRFSISSTKSVPALSQAFAMSGAVSRGVTTQRSQTIRLSDPTTSVVWNAPDQDRASNRVADPDEPRRQRNLGRVEPAPLAPFPLAKC